MIERRGQWANGVRRWATWLAMVLSLLTVTAAVVVPAFRVAAQTTYTVTSLLDNFDDASCIVGSCTLRQVVNASNANDPGAGMSNTITFDPTVFNVARTITLTTASGPLTLSRGVTITGTGANLLTLDGGCTDCAPGTVPMGGPTTGIKVFLITQGGTYTISGMTVQHGNGSNSGSGSGGAVDVNSGSMNTVTLSGLVLRENVSTNAGGAVATGFGGGTTALTITDSTLERNTAALANVTITGNTTTVGSGFLVGTNATATFTDVTVVGNTGGGIRNAGTSTTTRTIIAGNTGGDVNGTLTGGNVSNPNNLIGDGTGGLTNGPSGNIVGTSGSPINPLLAPLGAYDGTTTTRPPLPGSRAIDTGGTGCTGADQRGLSRPVTTCDIGAVESRGFTLATTGGNNQSATIGTLFTTPLAVSVTGNTVTTGITEPVAGGRVAFAPPGSGASAAITGSPATLSGTGAASAMATANMTVGGPYNVVASASGTTSVNFALTNTGTPDLAITKTHGGTFTQGQTGATYTITVTNGGTAATSGTVTVADTLPTGLTATALSGTGWTCSLGTTTCTRSDALAATMSYPAITLTVNVATNAPASVTNTATVSGGGDATPGNNTANDVTTVVPLPNLTINDVTAAEGNAGTTSFAFTVTLSAPAPAGGVTFDLATADGTASAGSDYTAKSLTAQTIPAGMNTYSFTVLVNGDTANEPNETFVVNIANVTGAVVTDGQGQGTITNDDPVPSLSINDVTANEGDSGTTAFAFTVTLSAASGQTVTVNYATADGTATTAGSDYTAASGTLTFAPGETAKTITVLVIGDTTFESNETFLVSLTVPTNATIATATGTGTITNDDAALNIAPTITAPASIAVTEDVATALTGISFADADAGSGGVTVTLSVPTSSGVLAATSGGSVVVVSGPNSLTLTGITASINAFIAASNVTFTTASNTTANVTLTVGINDNGYTGAGGAQSASTTVTLAVTAVNDAPTITQPASPITGTVGTMQTVMLAGISAGPANENTQTLTVAATSGNTAVVTNAGIAVTYTSPNATGNLAFTPVGAGTAVITVAVMDNGGTMNGGVNTASVAFTVNVSAAITACVVNSILDPTESGKTTLRDAVTQANAGLCTGDTITFDPTVFNVARTITLTTGQLALTRGVTITGPGATLLTVTRSAAVGTPQFRIFQIASGITATISGLTISGGDAGGGDGGGIYNQGTLTLTDVVVRDNRAGNNGGGIEHNNGGTLTLTNVTVRDNTAGFGGGINVFAATLNATTVTVSGNTAGFAGGGLAIASGSMVTLTNATVSGNTATTTGGGLYIRDSTAALTNATVSGNTSNFTDGGGGLRIESTGTTTLTNVTVSGNTAPTGSGGISVVDTAVLNATRSIVAGNTNGDLGGNGINGTNVNNLTMGNPLLAPLGAYGGTTQTRPPLPGSPAIDAGGTGCSATDQRGLSRPVNTTCDIGAVESRGFTLTATSGTPQSATAGTMFAAPLVATVAGSMGEPVANGTVAFTLPGSMASGTFGTATGCTNSAMNTVTTCTVNMSGVATSPTITANLTAGAYTATANTAGVAAGVTFALTNTAPAITVLPTTLPTGTVGTAYPAQTLTASGGTAPYTFSVAMGSTLPPGLTLTGNMLSGTPTMAGMFTFTLRVTDTNGFTGNRPYTVTVNGRVTVNPASLPAGTVGTAYTQTLTASGGTGIGYTFAVTTGMLPMGLALNATTGAITGTPTAAGMSTVTVTATDSAMNTGSRPYTVTINAAVAVAPATLPTGTVGVAYSQTLTASGGTGGGYTFAVSTGSLPPGLALSSAGAITGTPTTVGMSAFTVRATDGAMNTGSTTYTVTIGAATVTSVAITRTSGGTVTGGVTNVAAGGTVQLALTATLSDGSMQPVQSGVMYTSGDTSKATVDGTGKVTTLSPGTVTITATYMGRTTTFTLTITAPGSGGLMPNPAPVVRPDAATAPAQATPQAAPPMRAAPTAAGGIGPQGNGTATPTPRPAPPMR